MTSNCTHFQARYQEWLDRRPAQGSPLEPALAGHPDQCPRCARWIQSMEVLRRALDFAEPERPSARFSHSLILLVESAIQPAPRRRFNVLRSTAFRVGLAAAACAAVALGAFLVNQSGSPPKLARSEPASSPVRPLSEVLLDAGEATFELARSTSEPAARVGRHALDDASNEINTWIAFAPAKSPKQSASQPPTDNFIATVGRDIERRVRPISGTAQHAFQFLPIPRVEIPPGA